MINFTEVRNLIAEAMIVDQFLLLKQFEKINSLASHEEQNDKRLEEQKDFEKILFKKSLFEKSLEASLSKRKERAIQASVSYPLDLPVSQKVETIKKLIQDNQLIIIAGETGSGKSTQLPKICLDMGLGQGGMIGHTQPRRIAARTLASRISEELAADIPNAEASALVACKVRFSDSVKESTQIKLMTDGILLAEIQNDPFLEQYQCIIIDEVHERSLNIDFLLGFIKRLLKKRKNLKVIVTSATVDVGKLSKHFNNAPILEVSGRNFPVDIHYIDYARDSRDGGIVSISNEDNASDTSLADVVDKILLKEFSANVFPLAQDILVFLATESEIRQHSKALRQAFQSRLDILPLYGRMPLAQQREIFSPKSKKRRLILASNVAETSVTVPNIGFVVDFGLARISRYSARTKVQQLPIEKISQASANQRAGRCGRIAPGICIRVYSQEDFESRDFFTQPEIQRTNLSSVILKMESLNLGRIESFPLLDMPDDKLVKDAYKLLSELEAVDAKEKLTPIGRRMALMPIDPRFSRMLIEAETFSCLEEVLIIVCGLSVNDPRQRPQEFQKQADAKHALFNYKKSDFLSYYKLWHLLEHKRRELSNAQFKRFCEEHFIAWNNVREWREMHRQLLLQMRVQKVAHKKSLMLEKEFDEVSFEQNFEQGEQGDLVYSNVHKAILKGLLSHVARIGEGFAYEGVNKRQLYIFPASNLMKQKSTWIMSAQLIETSRLYAHCCAEIQSQWLIEQGQHLLSRKLFEPFWSKKQGCVQAYQQLSLGGLIVEARKPVKLNKSLSHELKVDLQSVFIQGALIERRYLKAPKALLNNWQALDRIHELEQKLRRVDLLPDDYFLQDFYRQRVPSDIFDTRSFENWLKQQEKDCISFDEKGLVKHQQADLVHEQFPDKLPNTRLDLKCDYIFNPQLEEDGLNIRVRFDQLNQLNQATLDWLVPGLIQEKCEALIKALPKSLRKQCLPIQDTVNTCLQRMEFGKGNLLDVLSLELKRKTGAEFKKEDFQLDKLPKHLRCHILLVDEAGKLIARSWELETLRHLLKGKMKSLSSLTVDDMEQKGTAKKYTKKRFENTQSSNKLNTHSENTVKKYTTWEFGDIERTIFFDRKAVDSSEIYRVKLYSALEDTGDSVELVYKDDSDEAAFVHVHGQRKLMELALASMKRDLKKEFRHIDQAALKLFSSGDTNQIFDDLFSALIDQVFFIENGKESLMALPALVFQQSDFEKRLKQGKGELFALAQSLFDTLKNIANKVFELRQSLRQSGSALKLKHLKWVEAHLLDLIRPGFISETPLQMLLRYPVYLDALQARIDRLQGNIDRDQELQLMFEKIRMQFKPYRESYLHAESGSLLRTGLFLKREKLGLVMEFSCLFEEFVMSHFSQNKKTLVSVSSKILEQKFTYLAS